MTVMPSLFCLRIFQPQGYRVLTLTGSPVTGGAGLENEIVLEGPAVPDLAFRLNPSHNGVDFGSVSPQCKASVNAKRKDSAFLRPGDRLEIGTAVLILDHAEASGEPFPPASVAPMPSGLSRLCGLVAGERDLKVLLEKTLGLLVEVFRADDAFLFTLDEGGDPKVFVGSRSEVDARNLYSDTVVGHVLRERKGLAIASALASPEFSQSESITALRLHSVLCCPIMAGGILSGLVYVGSKRPSVSYAEIDLRELEIYALVAGCLINHVGFIALQRKLLAMLRGPGEVSFIASCATMQRVKEEAQAVAGADISVLLQGETGTGKDVLAKYIHEQGRRRGKPFMVVNCSTLCGELLASELFGHRKGAFTGALKDQPGLFQAADGGTLFLDEIGEMDMPLQAMLLRTLETGLVRPVGQTGEIKIDVRILCATNRDLEEMVSAGTFRRDLYYRVNQHLIRLPPLRERGEDVILLAHHFLEKARGQYPDKRIEGFHPESLFAISRYAWPGNVRELANAVNKAVLFSNSPAVRVSLPEKGGEWIGFEEATRRFQVDYLLKALTLCGGDKEKAAERLGMGRSTFFRHLAAAKGESGNPD